MVEGWWKEEKKRKIDWLGVIKRIVSLLGNGDILVLFKMCDKY